MKRIGNLWPELVSLPGLLGAAKKAAAGKRTRPDVAAFLMNLEGEVLRLQRELVSGTYEPGEYRTFEILDPKPRLIAAAPFRDRVVHHALTGVLEPVFERRFSAHSYACRPGKGTHSALARAKKGVRRFPYALKCDVRKYFATIDHTILNEQLARVVKCRPTLDLAAKIIAGWKQKEDSVRYFPGDDLFTPFERRRGLPLGNQTSQFFAKVYLTPVDRMIEADRTVFVYARYVDDLLLFGESKEALRETRERLVRALAALRVEMHPGKSRVYRSGDGVTFLGWRLLPEQTRLVRENVVRFRRRMTRLHREYHAGTMEWGQVKQSVQAWLGHAAHGDTWVLREQLLAGFAF